MLLFGLERNSLSAKNVKKCEILYLLPSEFILSELYTEIE